MAKFIKEEGIFLVDTKVFKDDKEHEYDCDCYDGMAIARKSDDDDVSAPAVVILEYPKLKDVLKDKKKVKHVLEYRGLYDLSPKDIHFGDIMMACGSIRVCSGL